MSKLVEDIRGELDGLRAAGTYKHFNVLESPQGPVVEMAGRGEVIVLSSNNYLGLAAHPDVVQAGIDGLQRYGAGTGSVRFICGTFAPHLELEHELAELSETDAALTYVSCWNANEAVIPSLTDPRTVIISDELNHASIIDAVRLSKPERKLLYKHSDMDELREALASCEKEQRKVVITDGVFSMDGYIADLPAICDLADRHHALMMVDDSHAVGVLGARGRGSPEYHGVTDRIDIVTGTLGKALGGGGGGYTSGRREIVQLLRQRSRPYLFSNSITPVVAAGSLRALELLTASTELVKLPEMEKLITSADNRFAASSNEDEVRVEDS